MSSSQPVEISRIIVSDRKRDLDEAGVARLHESISQIGLLTPITLRQISDRLELVAGAHRLEAVKRSGEKFIEAVIIKNWTNDEARRWEISENLHRADLTEIQRAEWIAEWISLTERVSAQVAPKPQGGRPEGGIRAAARELGIERTQAQRAIKVAGLTAEAKKAAKEAGLDKNQRALVAASRAEPDKQAEVLRTWKSEIERRYVPAPAVTKKDPPDMYVVARQLAAKYSVIELTQLIDHLGDLIKEREAA